MNDLQRAIASKILHATVNNAGFRDEKIVVALWAELEASGVAPRELELLHKAVSRELRHEDQTVHDPLRYDGRGKPIDLSYLAREASSEEIDRYLVSFDSYKRTLPMLRLMTASSHRRCLQIFLGWGNMCDAPWRYRSYLALELRSALAKIPLVEMLGSAELSFYTELPDQVPVWRGCERGRERGLSWTTDRAVAEGFARGKRCFNEHPMLVSAAVPKQHIFAVFLDRQESELAVDPRRLRKLRAESLLI